MKIEGVARGFRPRAETMERRVISATPGGELFLRSFSKLSERQRHSAGGILREAGAEHSRATSAPAAAYSSAHGVIISTKLVSGPRKDKSVGRGRPI
ncbi:hypothetical protein K0M31_019330, partial [Melipona bicolor]